MYSAGYVGLFGFPNSGKSTLLNAIIGEKVAIVSPKPQTTRKRVTGIVSKKDYQAVFVDTPGFVHGPLNPLNEYIHKEIDDALSEVDVAVFLLAADEIATSRESVLLKKFSEFKKPKMLVVTKMDLINEKGRTRLTELQLDHVLYVSVFKKPQMAIKEVLAGIADLLPTSPAPLYDPETYTTQTLRDLASEIILEKCFLNLGQEVPYNLAVKVNSFKEGKTIRIESDIIVNRSGHKGIVIGEGGKKLKAIGSDARRDLEEVLGSKVYLGLHVKYKPEWMKSKTLMREFGYERNQ